MFEPVLDHPTRFDCEPASKGDREERSRFIGAIDNGRAPLNPLEDCPITAAQAALGGKWKLIIVYWLSGGSRHFTGLRRLLPGVSSKVLSEQLRQLIDEGLVVRHSTGAVPAPVEYELTDYGRSVVPIMEALRVWGRGHLERKKHRR
jgi:DNA-binding HxlR family transcriptional regulator